MPKTVTLRLKDYADEERIQLAVYRYQTEELSLAKAADLAGLSWARMKEILLKRGVSPKLGPETIEEAEREVSALRDREGASQA
jgi:predicted HTH domain antitoxin